MKQQYLPTKTQFSSFDLKLNKDLQVIENVNKSADNPLIINDVKYESDGCSIHDNTPIIDFRVDNSQNLIDDKDEVVRIQPKIFLTKQLHNFAQHFENCANLHGSGSPCFQYVANEPSTIKIGTQTDIFAKYGSTFFEKAPKWYHIVTERGQQKLYEDKQQLIEARAKKRLQKHNQNKIQNSVAQSEIVLDPIINNNQMIQNDYEHKLDVDLFNESTLEYINAQQQNYDLSHYTSKTQKRFKTLVKQRPVIQNVETLMKNFEVTSPQQFFGQNQLSSPKNLDLQNNQTVDFSTIFSKIQSQDITVRSKYQQQPFGQRYARSKTAKIRRRTINCENEIMAQSSLEGDDFMGQHCFQEVFFDTVKPLGCKLKSYENTSLITTKPLIKRIPTKSYQKLSQMYPQILQGEKQFKQVRAKNRSISRNGVLQDLNKNIWMGGQKFKAHDKQILETQSIQSKKKEIKKMVEVSQPYMTKTQMYEITNRIMFSQKEPQPIKHFQKLKEKKQSDMHLSEITKISKRSLSHLRKPSPKMRIESRFMKIRTALKSPKQTQLVFAVSAPIPCPNPILIKSQEQYI